MIGSSSEVIAFAALSTSSSQLSAIFMGREESVILPAAQKYLNAQDWAAIDAAFAANGDPDFGGDVDRDFRHLFSRIVNLSAR